MQTLQVMARAKNGYRGAAAAIRLFFVALNGFLYVYKLHLKFPSSKNLQQ